MSAEKQNHIIKVMIGVAKARGQVLTCGEVGRRLSRIKKTLGTESLNV